MRFGVGGVAGGGGGCFAGQGLAELGGGEDFSVGAEVQEYFGRAQGGEAQVDRHALGLVACAG